MVILKPGDRVDVLIKDCIIINTQSNFDEIRTFEVIANENYGFYLYIPQYILIKGTLIADQYRCKQLNIDRRYLNENICFIQQGQIYKVNMILDGMKCCKCQEFYEMSASNQPDGTLICWNCKNYPYYSDNINS